VPELRWGLTLPFPGVSLADHEPLFRQAQERGYDDMWTGETNGADGFTPLALASAWTQSVRLGTGIVNPFTRGVPVLAQHAAALADASGGRFCLGLGSSSDVIVERWNGIPFSKPLTRVREAVEALRPVLRGERGPGGFKLDPPPAHPVPIYIAALRDRMLQLGGELGDGTFVNFLPLSAVGHVTEQIRVGERRGRRDQGSSDVVCRFFCVPKPEEEGLAMARYLFAAYATVPVYTAFFRSLGWAEQLDPMVEAWEAGDRKLALERAPDDLIREIFIFGSPEQQRERLEQFAAHGISTLVLSMLCDPQELPGLIDALAP
jgi:probable F420-dependent oxidoreductase